MEPAEIKVKNTGKGNQMNIMMKELASINFFVIWLVVFGGFFFLRIMKNYLES